MWRIWIDAGRWGGSNEALESIDQLLDVFAVERRPGRAKGLNYIWKDWQEQLSHECQEQLLPTSANDESNHESGACLPYISQRQTVQRKKFASFVCVFFFWWSAISSNILLCLCVSMTEWIR